MEKSPEFRSEGEFSPDEGAVIEVMRNFVLEVNDEEGFPFNIVQLPYRKQQAWLSRIHIDLAERISEEILDGSIENKETSRGGSGKTLLQLTKEGKPNIFAWGDPKKELPKDVFERYFVSVLWDFEETKGGLLHREPSKGQILMKRTDIQLFSGRSKEHLPLPELSASHIPYLIKTSGRRGKRDARLVVGKEIELETIGEDMAIDLKRYPGKREAAIGSAGIAAATAALVIGTKVITGIRKRK